MEDQLSHVSLPPQPIVPKKNSEKPLWKILIKIVACFISVIIIIAVIGYLVVTKKITSESSAFYTTYTECVAATTVPCLHSYVGDFGQQWNPSPYRSKEECDTKSGYTNCIIPPGVFTEERWIPAGHLHTSSGPVHTNGYVLGQHFYVDVGETHQLKDLNAAIHVTSYARGCEGSPGCDFPFPHVDFELTVNGVPVENPERGFTVKGMHYSLAFGNENVATFTISLADEECLSQKENIRKDSCWRTLAGRFNDQKYCAKIENTNLQQACYAGNY